MFGRTQKEELFIKREVFGDRQNEKQQEHAEKHEHVIAPAADDEP